MCQNTDSDIEFIETSFMVRLSVKVNAVLKVGTLKSVF